MITRRLFGKAVALVTGDGLVRPVNAPAGQATPPGVQPGTSQALVVANQVVIIGKNGGLFIYSPAAGFGNLIASVTGSNGFDKFGNRLIPGMTSYLSGIQAISIDGDALTGYSAPNAGGPWTAAGGVIQVFTTDFNVFATTSVIQGQVTATGGTAALPTVVTTDNWQALALLSGWTGTAQCKMEPNKRASLRTLGSIGGGANANGTQLFAVTGNYIPANTQSVDVTISAVGAGSAATGDTPYALVTAGTGAVTLFNAAIQNASNLRINGSYALD